MRDSIPIAATLLMLRMAYRVILRLLETLLSNARTTSRHALLVVLATSLVSQFTLFSASTCAQSNVIETSIAGWRSQVAGQILGPTKVMNDDQNALVQDSPPDKHAIAMFMSERKSDFFQLPDQYVFLDVETQLVEQWSDAPKHLPLLGPARRSHRLYLCTAVCESGGEVLERKFVIDYNCFEMVSADMVDNRQPELLRQQDRMLQPAKRKFNAFPQLDQFDQLPAAENPEAPQWPDFIQGGWHLKFDWIASEDGVRNNLVSNSSFQLLVSGSQLFLYQLASRSISALTLLACDENQANSGGILCFGKLGDSRAMFLISENEFVILTQGQQTQTGFKRSRIAENEAKDFFKRAIDKSAILVDNQVIRFRGKTVDMLRDPLIYQDNVAELSKLYHKLRLDEASRLLWFHGDASLQRSLDRLVSSD